MAQANVFFLYDIDTEELLGFAAFEGTFKGLHLSEDEKGFEMDVENYHFIPFEGSITPTIKDGVLYLGIYEILSKCDSTAVDVEVIPLPCGPPPEILCGAYDSEIRGTGKVGTGEPQKRSGETG